MKKNSPAIKRILVLSDIHFGSLAGNREFDLEETTRSFLSNSASMKGTLIELLKSKSIDLILLPGDLTSTAKPKEFIECHKILCEIANELGVHSSNVLHTYGNHDADWTISKLAEAAVPKSAEYHQIAAHVGAIFLPDPQPVITGPVPGSGIFQRDGVVVFVLNSGYYCTTEQRYPHGRIGEAQLNWLKTQSNRDFDYANNWHVLMVHHHPRKYSYPTTSEDTSHIEEGSELLDIIGRGRFDIVCHGHRHHPKLFTQMETDWRFPKTFLCAGSLAVDASHRNAGEFPNMFHLIELQHRDELSHHAVGIVESYAYTSRDGWRPHERSPTVDIEAIQFFGPLASENEIELKLASLLQSRSKEPAPTVMLPHYAELELQFKCITYHRLNAILDKVVREGAFGKLIGKYPERVALMRSSS